MLSIVAACQSSKSMKSNDTTPDPQPIGQVIPSVLTPLTGGGCAQMRSPQVFIYKTKADYYNYVPVMMNDQRTAIVSYPAPIDLVYGGKLRLPTHLVDGWLLDNRGIGPNVAFLSYTYEEYSQMATAPTMAQLMEHIIDKHPLTTFRFCGPRADYTDLVPQLNKLIEGNFSSLPNELKLQQE